MKFAIVAVGRVRERYIKQGIDEYLKRLRAYGRVEIIEVKEESFREPLSDRETLAVLEREGLRISAKIPAKSYVVALDRLGKTRTSQQLADTVEQLELQGRSHTTLIIGGSLGLSPRILKRADFRLSFSSFTFPHQLIRLILLEQLYRIATIRNGERYHK